MKKEYHCPTSLTFPVKTLPLLLGSTTLDSRNHETDGDASQAASRSHGEYWE
jgi:hypothetical protein